MVTFLRSWATNLRDAAERSVRYSRRHMRVLGIAGAASLTGYYFIWRLLFPDDYENLLVRTIGSLLCVPVILYAQQPDPRIDKWLPMYWTVSVTYVLPFVFGFMLVQNAAHAEAIGDTSVIWPMQNVVALVLFILLINDGFLATLLWLPTTALLLLLVPLTSENANWDEIHRVFVQPLPLYAFILIVGSLTIRNREIIDQEKLRAVASIGSNIAHELRTPLLGMRALAEGIQMYLPDLVCAYEAAVTSGLIEKRLGGRQIAHLSMSADQLQREIEQSNSIIDMLLVNSAERPLQGLEFERFSAADLVDEALRRFPFATDSERNRVTAETLQDFSIRAPRILLVHVLFNLLKNALYYIAKAGRGDIRIRLGRDANVNLIVVEDGGTGVPPENLRRIFDRFFTTTETGQGSGIGLSFCKMVLEGIGGRIFCESELKKYTRFVLVLPRASV